MRLLVLLMRLLLVRLMVLVLLMLRAPLVIRLLLAAMGLQLAWRIWLLGVAWRIWLLVVAEVLLARHRLRRIVTVVEGVFAGVVIAHFTFRTIIGVLLAELFLRGGD